MRSYRIFIAIFFFAVLMGQNRPIERIKVAKAPHFMALSPSGDRLFITGFADNDVQVVSLPSLQPVQRFYGGFEPLGIAIEPSGSKIFVTNLSPGQVKVIDAETYRAVDDIVLQGRASNITLSPNGQQAFVMNFGRGKIGRVDVIDVASHQILREIEVGVRPMAGVVSPAGDRLFVACAGSNDLYVIDINRHEVVKEIPVGLGPDGVSISPNGLTLYVANSGTNDVSVIDLLDLREKKRVPVGRKPFSMTVAPDGRVFIVESADKAVSVYSPEFQKIATYKVRKRPIDVLLSPDAKRLYVTDEKDNRVFVFNVPQAGGEADSRR